ncbi:MAG: capsule assembly Wzi family protein [Bacillota bacterium]
MLKIASGNLHKKVVILFIIISSVFSPVVSADSGEAGSGETGGEVMLKMLPGLVRMRILTGDLTYGDWLFSAGLYAEGHQHQPGELVVEPDSLTATYRRGLQQFRVGYFRPAWGTEEFSSVMLSGEAPALPGISYETSFWGNYSYQRFGMHFPGGRGDFFGHRLEIMPAENFCLGLKETVIYTEDFPGYWLNGVPFWPYYLLKYIPGTPSDAENMNVGIDVHWTGIENTELYGDLHVTEWPLRPESTQPRVYGLKLGLLRDDFYRDDLTFRLEYQRLMNYLYSASVAGQNYQYGDFPLGSIKGPDFEEIDAGLRYSVSSRLSLAGGLKLGRKGKGEVGDYWDTEDDDGVGSMEEAHNNMFLTGVVEERLAPRAGFCYRPQPGVEIELELEVEFVDNYKHEQGQSGTRTRGLLMISQEF